LKSEVLIGKVIGGNLLLFFVSGERTLALLNAVHWISKHFTNCLAIRLILIFSINWLGVRTLC